MSIFDNLDLSAAHILSRLNAAKELVKVVAPLVGFGGETVEKVTTIATAALDLAENVKNRIEEGQIVMESHDKDQLEAILAQIQEANDELARRVAES